MPIRITYRLSNEKLIAAVEDANATLTSTNLLDLLTERSAPFDESRPHDLKPAIIAGLFEQTELQLTLHEYTARNSSIGGKFNTGTPNRIYANRLAVPKRDICALGCMLVHECTHALSWANRARYSFSHDSVDGHDHSDTAPYWIQRTLRRQFCLAGREPARDDLIIVELTHEESDLDDDSDG
jgi:hypothetical protein